MSLISIGYPRFNLLTSIINDAELLPDHGYVSLAATLSELILYGLLARSYTRASERVLTLDAVYRQALEAISLISPFVIWLGELMTPLLLFCIFVAFFHRRPVCPRAKKTSMWSEASLKGCSSSG